MAIATVGFTYGYCCLILTGFEVFINKYSKERRIQAHKIETHGCMRHKNESGLKFNPKEKKETNRFDNIDARGWLEMGLRTSVF